MRIGVYGGTFNPPHIGHRRSATAAAAALRLDLLIVVPAGIPPHKPLPEGSPSAQTRFIMTKYTFGETDSIIISDFEIGRNEPVYTIDTVRSILSEYPGSELFLLTGTDMFLSLLSWRESETLLKTVKPAVFSRNSDDREKIADYSGKIKELTGADIITIFNEAIEISSSELRQMLPQRDGAGYITDTTYSYIIRNKLYGAKPGWDWLRKKAYTMLNPARIPHVEGCESEAMLLAGKWGIDPDDAREAAILHDITKRFSADEHIRLLEKEGIPAGESVYTEEKLLHARTGALLAKSEFGVSDEVMNAIMWHTTGRANMTDLEKIIYLADYIEPERDFDGVEELRALAYEDLDKALIRGLEMSIEDMTERGIVPNRVTIDALDSIKRC